MSNKSYNSMKVEGERTFRNSESLQLLDRKTHSLISSVMVLRRKVTHLQENFLN